MLNRVHVLSTSLFLCFLLSSEVRGQSVTNVRAQQPVDRSVEVLDAPTSATTGGATGSSAFFNGEGIANSGVPVAPARSRHVWAGVASDASQLNAWNAVATMSAQPRPTISETPVIATSPQSRLQEITYTLPGGVPIVMVRVPAGRFQMGAPESERGSFGLERPVHWVTLTADYYIGKYEVTQAQWQAVMGANPSYFKNCGGNCPVERVSWEDIHGTNGFIERLNGLLGDTGFRLPTEAEWERAARGGTQTRFSFGDALNGDDGCKSNAEADNHLWWCGNSGNSTHLVGTKAANPYGLHDMHGNVMEWAKDWHGPYPSAEQTDPTGPSTGVVRAVRGGCWGDNLSYTRSAHRLTYPEGRYAYIGFRLARSAEPIGDAPPSVLFAHGICSDCDAWTDMATNLTSISATRYGSAPPVDLYWDGSWVRNKDDDNQFYPSRGANYGQIPAARLYTITYFDSAAGSKAAGFDKMRVKDIPIERLAGQLAAVVAAIRARNHQNAVDVVSHSMGGLVTRTLIEGLGSPASQLEAYVPGSIRQVVTINTPHSGFPKAIADATVASLNVLFPPSVYADFSVCVAANSVQKRQMNGFPLSDFLSTLNSAQIPGSVPVTAIATKTSTPWYAPWYLPEEWPHDGVVLTSSQDIKSIETYRCSPAVVTLPYSASGPIPHVTVLGKTDTALLVHGVLARDSVTGPLGGCQAFSPSTPSTLSLPSATQPTAGTRTLTLTFPVGAAPAGLRGLAETTCRATVVVRANDGRELGRYEVPASGTQTVELGVLPASGWTIQLIAGCAVSVSAHLGHQPEDDFGTATRETVLPIALDVKSGSAHYTTELSLVNRGQKWALATIRYASSLGGQGSGTVIERLSPGSQRVYGNVLEFLRQRGLPIPTASQGQQGGTLTVAFSHADSIDAVAASARTTSATAAPQPAGAAGLSYSALPTSSGSEGSVTLFGLRDNAQDRSNVAVFNPSSTPVTVRMTAFAGDGTGYSAVVRDSLTLPAYGWTQVSNVFSGTGISSGWVTVQRTSASGRFGVYGVINDNATNDGSFVQPTLGTISGSRLTVPVLVETSAFRSELVLANRGSATATLTVRYVERLAPALGSGGTATIRLRPREQLVVPSAIEDLRRRGIAIGAMGAASYAGALRVSVSGASLSDVFAGARTASPSPAGGQFGLFTPGVYESETAGAEAYVYGLRADTTSRSNLAVVHAGSDSDGGVTLEVQVYDGDRGGVAAGSPRVISLSPGQWEQVTGILGGVAVQNGWVRVRRTAGTAPWIAYGVINDGGNPGERTGDGAYVPMISSRPVDPCGYRFMGEPSMPLPREGVSRGTVTVGYERAECQNWVPTTDVNWLILNANYDFEHFVEFSASPYTGSANRYGHIRVGSAEFRVFQAGSQCTYSVSPTTVVVPHSGGTASVQVQAPPGCEWTTSRWPYVSFPGGNTGFGSATVAVVVEPYPSAWSGGFGIAGKVVRITPN